MGADTMPSLRVVRCDLSLQPTAGKRPQVKGAIAGISLTDKHLCAARTDCDAVWEYCDAAGSCVDTANSKFFYNGEQEISDVLSILIMVHNIQNVHK